MSLAGSLSALPYFFVIVVGYFLYTMIMRMKFTKDVEGKIWGEFFAANGQSYGELCKVSRGCVQAPKGHEIGMYFTTPETSYDHWYPPGRGMLHRLVRVRIRRTVWNENNPVPRVATDPAKWIESEKVKDITSFMIETAANESFQKSALEMQKQFWSEITQIVKFVKNVPMLLWVCLGSLGASAIAAYFAYMCLGYIRSRFP